MLVASTGGVTKCQCPLPTNGIDVVPPTLIAGNAPATGGSYRHRRCQLLALPIDSPYVPGHDRHRLRRHRGAEPSFRGPTGGVFEENTSSPASSGFATISGVILDTAGTYVVQAASGNAIPADYTITVVAAAQAKLVITEEPPASVVARAGFNLVAEAEDRFNNPATLTGSVSLAIATNPGGSTLGGLTTVAANATNPTSATFSGLTLNKIGSGYTIEASSGKLTSATTTGITVTPALATQLVIQPNGGPPPATVSAGQSFQMIVDAEDQFGNLVASFNSPVVITSPTNIAGTPAMVNNGVATFTLTIDTAGTYQIKAASTGLSSVTSSSVTVTAATAAQLIFVTEPPSSLTAGWRRVWLQGRGGRSVWQLGHRLQRQPADSSPLAQRGQRNTWRNGYRVGH